MHKEIETNLGVIVTYSKKHEPQLIDAYKILMASESGKRAILSRFWHKISLDDFIAYLRNQEIRYRAIVQNQSSGVIGWGEFYINPENSNEVMTARIILSEYQSRGLGKQLFLHLVEKCKELLPEVSTIISIVDENNVAAIQSLTKLLPLFSGELLHEPECYQFEFKFHL